MTKEEKEGTAVYLHLNLGISIGLARDLLKLAGDDLDIVFDASKACNNLESMKIYIIDSRLKKLEGRNIHAELQTEEI